MWLHRCCDNVVYHIYYYCYYYYYDSLNDGHQHLQFIWSTFGVFQVRLVPQSKPSGLLSSIFAGWMPFLMPSIETLKGLFL